MDRNNLRGMDGEDELAPPNLPMHLSRFMVVCPFSLQQETACPRPELANHTQGSSHWLFASTKHLLDSL
ncbi:hypothetical protein IGI04_042229 [Brassica rapa subsp. trilocularis]|uniref:Uncharacterized protein n=1 Tax=Brassica rapa subsp. trilocularis TaxID=1813537 RepID=A0ABQ7KIU6_BRACM|nr:hypothetical protein IGI04_042229 [Brassica rapa subsp. trilocularis]